MGIMKEVARQLKSTEKQKDDIKKQKPVSSFTHSILGERDKLKMKL
jgi:hypothetical protein